MSKGMSESRSRSRTRGSNPSASGRCVRSGRSDAKGRSSRIFTASRTKPGPTGTYCRQGGFELVDAEPRPGSKGRLVAFVHPRSLHGVLLELVEEPRTRLGSTQRD